MVFQAGIQYSGKTVTENNAPAPLHHLVLPNAIVRYVYGPFGNYLSQSIETEEISFYLHHFHVTLSTRLFARVESPVLILLRLLKGNAALTLHGGVQMALTEQLSYLFYLRAGMEHFIDLPGQPVTVTYFHYHTVFVKEIYAGYPVLKNLSVSIQSNNDSLCEPPIALGYIENYLWRIFPALLKTEIMPKAFVSEKGRELLRHYCHALQVIKEIPGYAKGSNLPEHELVLARAVKDLIEADLRVHYTLDQLAWHTGWNSFGLSQVFPKVYGLTPYQYLIKQRMEFARHLVLTTRDLISSISADCGYKQEHHFIKLFKETYGVTPGGMRQKDFSD